VRSDGHMREVLRLYESTYRANFAREMLKKSGNLVVCPSPLSFHIFLAANLFFREKC
jgi:hypothetical protein